MGELKPFPHEDDEQSRAFMRELLDDVRALDRMLKDGHFEAGVRRIGAEQEFFLVDRSCEPAPVAMEMLDRLKDPTFTTELARFNLEANLPPYGFTGDCLGRMERDIGALMDKARAAAGEIGADILLAGILPTLQIQDLGLHNMTPMPRYQLLNDALVKMRGGDFHVRIKGIDEFYAVHDNVMLESCNTSFQVHFQVDPAEFVDLYNLAQAVTAPVLAAAVNSPFFLERRLWHETRVALFQHSVDSRSQAQIDRGQRPRVRFGDRWIEESVLEIFRDDIARFRVLLRAGVDEKPLSVLDAGGIPQLRALCVHNGTVYRWNRPCYGVHEGKAHLRIENRVLPAGPTIVDEVANAAFFFGLMSGMSREYPDITKAMDFADAASNFLAAARHGLGAQFTWVDGRSETAAALILDQLLPLARAGLEHHEIRSGDVDRYLGVLEDRVRAGMTGARWALRSVAGMGVQGTRHYRCRALTAAMLARQKEGSPVHTWKLAGLNEALDWRHSYKTVGQFMTTDLFTVRPDDLVDLAANLMDWEHIRHVPVEDGEGRLLGLVSHRTLIRLLAQGVTAGTVRSIMRVDPITVAPETSTLEAIEVMRKNRVACLPVVSGGKLVGILTERDLIEVAARLLDEQLRELDKS